MNLSAEQKQNHRDFANKLVVTKGNRWRGWGEREMDWGLGTGICNP